MAFPDTGKCVGNLVEKNLFHFVRAGGLTEVARERYPILAVDALTKTCLRVVPSKAPLVEPVLGKELACSRFHPEILSHTGRVTREGTHWLDLSTFRWTGECQA